MDNILEVVNRIPQIDSVALYEKKDFYILTVSYTPRYGYGMISQGSSCHTNEIGVFDYYQFITISDIEADENWKIGDEFKPQTEIRLRFPEIVYNMFMDRDKETESYIFCKSSFYNYKKLVRLSYKD
jgi:hypothetical protein